MTVAIAEKVHGMMPASAETRLGRTGAVLRRRISRLPEERDQIGEMGRLRSACGGERGASAAEGTSAKAQWRWLGAPGRFRGSGRARVGPLQKSTARAAW